MTTQADMFENFQGHMTIRAEVQGCPAPPAQRGSATSVAAAQAVRPDANTQRALVLSFLRGCGERGAIREEIGDALGMDSGTVCPRIWELMQRKHGALVTGTSETRLTTRNRPAAVLRAV